MRLRTRTALLASAGVLAIAGTGAAIGVAASGGGSPSEDFAAALSDRVGTQITAEQIEQAREDVMRDRLEEAVQQGRLTQEQADELLERKQERQERHQQRHQVRDATSVAVADFLGLAEAEIREQRQDGKSLAQIAEDQGKTRAGLLDVVKKAIREGTQAAGGDPLTDDEIDQLAERIVDREGHPGGRGFRGGHGGPGLGGPFGP